MSKESEVTRRDFLKTTTGAAALGGISFLARPQRVWGANDRVRVAVCGVHGRGMDHVEGFSKLKNVEIAAICDVDENVLRERLASMREDGPRQAGDLLRRAQAARGQIHRRHFHCHAESLALADGASGRARRARTFTSKSPARTISGKAGNWCAPREKYNRIVQHGTQIRSARGRSRGHPEDPRRPARRRLHGARPLLQVAQHDWPRAGRAGAREACTTISGPGPAPLDALHAESLPLQLALVLELRQRRHRQPG